AGTLIAVEDSGAMDVVVKSRLLVRRLRNIQKNTIGSGAAQNGLPGFVDDWLIGAAVNPSVFDPAQHREADHCCCRELRVRARMIHNLAPETVLILELGQ